MSRDPTDGQKVWMMNTLAEAIRVLENHTFEEEQLSFLATVFTFHPQVEQLMHQAQHVYSNRHGVHNERDVK